LIKTLIGDRTSEWPSQISGLSLEYGERGKYNNNKTHKATYDSQA